MSLGQNIKRLRQEAFQTQAAFAKHLNVPQTQVSDWENDRYAVLETLTLVKIAKALRCSVDQLLAGVDPEYDCMLQMEARRVSGRRTRPRAGTRRDRADG